MEAIERELTEASVARSKSTASRQRRKELRGTLLSALSVAARCGLLLVCLWVPWLHPFRGDALFKTLAWSVAVLGAFAGWGSLVGRCFVPDQRPPLSLCAVWGAGVLALLGGVLASVSLLSGSLLLGYVVAGVALLAHRWVQQRHALGRDLVVRLRASRLWFGALSVALVLAGAVAIRYVGGASDTTSNPYDDDNAYYTFAKMLLERGTLLDPFSFRRMSTLGGQALFHAVLLTKIDVPHLNVFDRSMSLLLAAGLIASYRVEGRAPPFLARALAVLFLVALPMTSINSASYYSGVAFFLALARSVDMLGDRVEENLGAAVRRIVPVALTGAAACTLRQNYQAAVGLFIVFSYARAVRRLRRGRSLRSLLVEPTACVLALAAFVAPWMVLLFRSNGTFLFPLMKGTFNAHIGLASFSMTWMKVFRFVVDVWLTPEPIQTQSLFFLAAMAAVATELRGVMKSMTMAAVLSIVALAMAFNLSDSPNLARYYHGIVLATVVVTWLTLATARGAASPSMNRLLPFAVALVALAAPIVTNASKTTAKVYEKVLRDVDEQLRMTIAGQAEPPVAAVYRRLQASVPAGAPILYMLDQPYYLDFRRNPLLNLDMPGIASPRPGMPNFEGPEVVASYLVARGIRHVAFVRSDRSTYLYRHEVWLERMYDPIELWRTHAPYILDTMQSLEALSHTRRRIYEEDGMVVIDLGATGG